MARIVAGHYSALVGHEIGSGAFLFVLASPKKCSLQATCSGSNSTEDGASCAAFFTSVSFSGVEFAVSSAIQPTYGYHQSHFTAYSLGQNVEDCVSHNYLVDTFTVLHSTNFEPNSPSYTYFS